MTLFLRPRLRSLGFEANRSLINSIEWVVNASTGISAVVTVVAGIVLVLRLRGNSLDTLFNTGWGYAILIGFIAAMGAFVPGAMSAKISARAASIAGEM